MSQRAVLEPFTKFLAEAYRGKVNHFKNALSNTGGLSDPAVQSLASRLLQSSFKEIPPLSKMTTSEWQRFGGRKLLREQAKAAGLLGSILPYETEGTAELSVSFNETHCRRGNMILPEHTIYHPSLAINSGNLQQATFLMFDCDFPLEGGEEKGIFLHWAKNSEAEIEYIPPAPERGSGIHRIVCLLLDSKKLRLNESRIYKSFPEITDNSSTDSVVAYNFFTTTWTRSVSEMIIAKTGLKERIFACVLLQPFDVIKTRIQESATKLSVPKAISSIARLEGSGHLWRGLVPTVIRNVPGTGLYFSILSVLKPADNSLRSNAMAGAVSRVAAGLALMPFTVLKVQMESKKFSHYSTPRLIRNLWQKEGLKGFYKGTLATALRDAPSSGVYFAVYQASKTAIGEKVSPSIASTPEFLTDKKTSHRDAVNTLSSLIASFVSTALTHPFDVWKTRIQLTSGQSGLSTCFDDLFTKFYRGFCVRFARKALNSAIVWVLYEKLSII